MVITLRSPNDPFVKAQDITSCSRDFGVTAATYQLYSYYALAAAVGAFLSASWLFYVSKKLFREARDNANLNASDPVTGNAQAKYAVSPVVLKDTPETQRKLLQFGPGRNSTLATAESVWTRPKRGPPILTTKAYRAKPSGSGTGSISVTPMSESRDSQ